MAGKSKYFEIKELIEATILQGEYPVGSKLPSEPQLVEIYNASRGTIRQALDALERDAIIARRSGAGTYVIRKPSKEPRVISLTKQVKAAGKKPVTKVLVADKIMASKAGGRVCEAFLLIDPEQAARTPVFRIDRLRCGDDQPLARQTLYLMASDFKPNLLEKEDLSQSIFDLYDRYHRRVAWADEIIQARPATPEEVELLQMRDLPPARQFVYVRDRISYDEQNLALEVMTSVDRGDFFRAYQYRIVADESRL
jgi:GntR family transcriptional regulator